MGNAMTRRRYKKGSKSKTMRGRKDFTTKKGHKQFNRRGHRHRHAKGSRVVRKPYRKRGGYGTSRKKKGAGTAHGCGCTGGGSRSHRKSSKSHKKKRGTKKRGTKKRG